MKKYLINGSILLVCVFLCAPAVHEAVHIAQHIYVGDPVTEVGFYWINNPEFSMQKIAYVRGTSGLPDYPDNEMWEKQAYFVEGVYISIALYWYIRFDKENEGRLKNEA
ncbi:MAG: hypothetical protein ACTSPB_02130 [Candidatus Thorarchaeota archaeon]